MGFKEAYAAYALTEGQAGTMEEVRRQLTAEYLQNQGTAGERFARAYGKLEDVFRECGSERSVLNLECFARCNDLLGKEAGRK